MTEVIENPYHKGATSELYASIYFLERGYDVFRNVSQNGQIDLVAIKDEEVLLIDVKTNSNSISEEQKRRGIIPFNVASMQLPKPIAPPARPKEFDRQQPWEKGIVDRVARLREVVTR